MGKSFTFTNAGENSYLNKLGEWESRRYLQQGR